MKTEMYKFATHRQKSPLNLEIRKSSFLSGQPSFDHVIDVIADDARVLYFVVAG